MTINRDRGRVRQTRERAWSDRVSELLVVCTRLCCGILYESSNGNFEVSRYRGALTSSATSLKLVESHLQTGEEPVI